MAIRQFAPAVAGRPLRVVVIGAGVQGHSHLPVLAHVLPGVHVIVADRHPDRAAELADLAIETPGIGSATAVDATEVRDATRAADIVVTAAAFGPVRQVMTEDWLGSNTMVVAVDYATYCSAEVVRAAALFLVDEREQFLSNRDAGLFEGYPDPDATLGEVILAHRSRPATGRVVVTHLGVGLADVIFGTAIVRRAEALGLGTLLA